MEIIEIDGFYCKTPGDRPFIANIFLSMDYGGQMFRVDSRLASFIGLQSLDPVTKMSKLYTREEVVDAVWNYVRTNKLTDPDTPFIIKCDRCFAALFETHEKQMRLSDFASRMNQLLYQPEPIVIRHNANTSGQYQVPNQINQVPPSLTNAGVSFENQTHGNMTVTVKDIEIELDDPFRENYDNIIKCLNDGEKKILELNDSISTSIGELNKIAVRREFFRQFSEDPADFIEHWLISQARDLRQMCVGIFDSNEPLRKLVEMDDLTRVIVTDDERSEYYDEKEAWVHEAVKRYMHSNTDRKRKEKTETEDVPCKRGNTDDK